MSELFGVLIVLLLTAADSSPAFAVLSVPGVLACLALRSALVRHPARRRFAISCVAGVSLSPFVVGGHSPVMLPLPFGVALANHMGFTRWDVAAQAVPSTVATFGVVFVLLARRDARANAKASDTPAISVDRTA
jgi:hypothetical protein